MGEILWDFFLAVRAAAGRENTGPLSLPRRGLFSCPELFPGHAHGGGDLFKRGHAGLGGQGFHLEVGLAGDDHAARHLVLGQAGVFALGADEADAAFVVGGDDGVGDGDLVVRPAAEVFLVVVPRDNHIEGRAVRGLQDMVVSMCGYRILQ